MADGEAGYMSLDTDADGKTALSVVLAGGCDDYTFGDGQLADGTWTITARAVKSSETMSTATAGFSVTSTEESASVDLTKKEATYDDEKKGNSLSGFVTVTYAGGEVGFGEDNASGTTGYYYLFTEASGHVRPHPRVRGW